MCAAIRSPFSWHTQQHCPKISLLDTRRQCTIRPTESAINVLSRGSAKVMVAASPSTNTVSNERGSPVVSEQLPVAYSPTQELRLTRVLEDHFLRDCIMFRDAGNLAGDYSHTKKLFIGGSHDCIFFAYLKIYPVKASQVVFYKELIGIGENKKLTETELDELGLGYPFNIFIGRRSKNAHKQLKALIQYMYLEARQNTKVFAKIAARSYENLSKAFLTIGQFLKNVAYISSLPKQIKRLYVNLRPQMSVHM